MTSKAHLELIAAAQAVLADSYPSIGLDNDGIAVRLTDLDRLRDAVWAVEAGAEGQLAAAQDDPRGIGDGLGAA